MPAMLLKPSCALGIIFGGRAVLAAIKLDDQRAFSANEVDDVPSNWYLASELEAG
jgi:hypothetical protein